MNSRIIIVGNLPPPVGGVTQFIKYLTVAFKEVGIEYDFFTIFYLFKYRNCIMHINYSNNVKRLIFILVGKVFFKKVFFVKHGGVFDFSSKAVMWSLKLSDGVFCLNEQVENQLSSFNVNTFRHSTIFKENIFNVDRKYKNNVPKVLFYANNDKKIEGESIYGIDFLLSSIDLITFDLSFTVLDLSSQHYSQFAKFANVQYLSEPCDFSELLSTHDIYIRPTVTDGMSVALLEAGLFGLCCLASDVVSRPEFVYTFKTGDKADFISQLEKISFLNNEKVKIELSSVYDVYRFMALDGVSMA